MKGHQDKVTYLALSPTGKILVSVGIDGSMRFWRAASDEEVRLKATGIRWRLA